MTYTACYMEKAEQAQQHLGTKTMINPAEETHKKQCKPKEAKTNAQRETLVKGIIIQHIGTPQAASGKSAHTCHTYAGMRPHAHGHQAGGHLVRARTERHIPPKMWTQAQCLP